MYIEWYIVSGIKSEVLLLLHEDYRLLPLTNLCTTAIRQSFLFCKRTKYGSCFSSTSPQLSNLKKLDRAQYIKNQMEKWFKWIIYNFLGNCDLRQWKDVYKNSIVSGNRQMMISSLSWNHLACSLGSMNGLELYVLYVGERLVGITRQ